MPRKRQLRTDWFWLLGIVIVLVLTVWWIPGEAISSANSYSTSAGGKRVFFSSAQLILESKAVEVRRNVESLIPQDDKPGPDTLVIIGPARYPTSSEWYQLANWVEQGNALIFAVTYGDPVVQADFFGASVSTDGIEYSQVDGGDLLNLQFSEELEWKSSGIVSVDEPDFDVLLSSGNDHQVIKFKHGKGDVVIVASDHAFSNLSLVKNELALLAFRVIESVRIRGTVYFDEYLNAQGAPRGFGMLFSPLFRAATLQLIMVVVLFGWKGSKRFGPVLPRSTPARRSIVEHARALGNMLYRARAAESILAWYREYLRNELRLSYSGVDQMDAVVLAQRCGMDSGEVDQFIKDVDRAIHEPILSTNRACSLIRRLAEMRQRLDRSEGIPNAT